MTGTGISLKIGWRRVMNVRFLIESQSPQMAQR
jgi:hypothetical protein